MATLYVLRHGETDWNAEGRLQGATDVPLNATGRAQAVRNGRALAAQLPDASKLAFTASPLRRASETLAIARGEMGLDPDGFATDPRLMEARFGTWEGRLMTDISAEQPELWKAARADRWNVVPPGTDGTTESFKMLAARVEAFLDETFRAGAGDALISTHAGVMRVVRVIFGESPAETVGRLETPQDRVMVVRDGAPISWM